MLVDCKQGWSAERDTTERTTRQQIALEPLLVPDDSALPHFAPGDLVFLAESQKPSAGDRIYLSDSTLPAPLFAIYLGSDQGHVIVESLRADIVRIPRSRITSLRRIVPLRDVLSA